MSHRWNLSDDNSRYTEFEKMVAQDKGRKEDRIRSTAIAIGRMWHDEAANNYRCHYCGRKISTGTHVLGVLDPNGIGDPPSRRPCVECGIEIMRERIKLYLESIDGIIER